MLSKNARAGTFRKSTIFWCGRFCILVVAFLAGLFLLSHDRFGVSLNPAFKHVDATLGLALYIAYLTLLAGILWIPAGLLTALVLRETYVTVGRGRSIPILVFFTVGLVSGIAFSWLNPSSIRPFLP
jgi:hypothetical protein